ELRVPRGRAGRRPRQGARDLPRADGGPEEAARGARQDRRGQAREVLHRDLPPGPAIHQGCLGQDPGQGPGGSGDGPAPGAGGGQAVRPLPGGRGVTGARDAEPALMADPDPVPAYRRVVLKLSGEALAGNVGYGIEPEVLARIAGEIRGVAQLGVQVAVAIGGGNISRGLAATA